MTVYITDSFAYRCFEYYLSDSQQYVSLNGEVAIWTSCDSPSCSVLGPLIFLIFINDFPNCSTFFKITLFVENSTLSCKFNNTPVDKINYIFNHPTNSHK